MLAFPRMANSADAARRKWGLIFLGGALVLLVFGQTVLKSWLGHGLAYLFYWLACLGFTLMAMLTALLDAWIVRTRARQQQGTLFKRTLMDERSSDSNHDS